VSDIVAVALIAAVPGTIAAIGTLLNRRKLGIVSDEVQAVDAKVDGHQKELTKLISTAITGIDKGSTRKKKV